MRMTIVVGYDSNGEISVGAAKSGADNEEDRVRLARAFEPGMGHPEGEQGVSFRQVEVEEDAKDLTFLTLTEYPELKEEK